MTSGARYTIEGGNYELGGTASRRLKEHLKKAGASPAVVRRAMIAAYEAEMNVVIHAERGVLSFRLDNGQLDVEIADDGPGINNIEQALKPGFSTASAQAREMGFGAGMGLPNIQRNSDTFTIDSTPGKGTTVRFGIRLRPDALYGQGQHSIAVKAGACQQCYQCLHVCPLQALRVRGGQPQVLDYLCVDCAACIAACPAAALHVAGEFVSLEPRGDTALLLPAAALVQFGPRVTPQGVLAALARLGFDEVRVTAGWHAALRSAAVAAAQQAAQPRPVIAPACQAVVNLIEVRYPSLIPHLLRCDVPIVAARAELGPRRVLCVLACPCERTALLGGAFGQQTEFVLPSVLRDAVQPHLGTAGEEGGVTGAAAATADAGVLQVSGIAHVQALLEEIEDGLVADVAVVEPYACEAAGFGAPLLHEEAALARHRWLAAPLPSDPRARAVPRATDYAARPGLRLDSDMSKAVQKLGRIDKTRRQLPGSDCGLCGAPTCAAFAEDVVLGRANLEDCPRGTPSSQEQTR